MSETSPARPHLGDYERTVLATALEHADTLDLVLATLRPGDLYDSRHQRLVDLLRDMVASGAPVDSVVVPEQIMRRGLAQAVGGVSYVIDLERWRAPSTLSIPHYLAELRQAAKLRSAIDAADRIHELARSGASGDEAVDQAVGILVQAASTTRRVDEAWAADAVRELRDDRERRAREDASGRSSRVRTGYAAVDALVPMLDGDVTVVAGLTSHGKSVTALNIADFAASQGFPVVYFSLEMDRRQLAARHVSMRCGVPYQLALDGRLDDGVDRARWEDGESMLIDQRLPLRVVDQFGITSSGIASRCWQVDREVRRLGFSQGLRLVVVDYLQKVEPDRRGGSREAEVSAISRGLKVLAGDLGCHVIALAQLSRAARQREDKRPQLYDLRESGSIEQDASNVIGAYWHYKEVHPAEAAAWKSRYELLVLKARAGDIGSAELEFRPWCGRLLNPRPKDPPAPPALPDRRAEAAADTARQSSLLGGG